MTQLTRISLLTSLLLTSVSPLALAAPAPDEATAAQLATKIQASLQTLLPAQFTTPGSELAFAGTTKVTVAGDVYALEIPALHAKTSDGSVDVGIITGMLTPTDGPGYNFALTLPTPLAVLTKTTSTTTLQVARQSLTGVWQPDLGFLPELHVALGDLAITDKTNNRLATISEAKLDSSFGVNGTEQMGGTATGSVAAITLFNDTSHEKFLTIDRLEMASRTSDVNAEAVRNLRENLQKLDAGDLAQGAPLLMGKVSSLVNSLQGVMGTGEGSFTLTNLAATDSSGKQPTLWKLPTASLGYTTGTNPDKTARLSFTYGHDRLSVTPALTGVRADLLPTTVGIGFTLDELPVTELAAVMAEAAATAPAATSGKSATPATSSAEAVRAKIEAIITQYKPSLVVNKVLFGAPALQSLSTGRFTANPAASFFVTGALDTKIAGIDALVTKVSALASPKAAAPGAPQPQGDPEAQGLLMALSMLQGIGQQAADGSRTYHFELGADGSAKMNGTDLAALLGMSMGMGAGGGAGSAPAPAPQTPPSAHRKR